MLRPTHCLLLCAVGVLAIDTGFAVHSFGSRDTSAELTSESSPLPGHSSGWQPDFSGPSAFVDSVPITPTGDSVPAAPQDDVRYFPEALAANNEPAGPIPSASKMSDEEAQIWREELSHLPEAQAAEIMELRSQLGSVLDSGPTELLPGAPPRALPDTIIGDARQIPVEPTSPNGLLLASATSESPAMLRLRTEATDVYRENLTNRMTPGFKRREILIISAPGASTASDENGPQGPTWVTRINMTQGEIRETGNPLDIAIHGRGWLKVSDGETEGFTRCGILGIDKEGRLGAWTGAGLLPLSPEVQVGTENEFDIYPDGAVRSTEEVQTDVAPVTRIALHTFRNPSALQRNSAGLYLATEASGEARAWLEQSPGQIIPAALEESNSQTDRERAELEQLLNLTDPKPAGLLSPLR